MFTQTVDYFQSPSVGQSQSHIIGLVVTTGKPSHPVYRHRHHSIDVMWPAIGLQFGSEELRQPTVDPGMITILGIFEEV